MCFPGATYSQVVKELHLVHDKILRVVQMRCYRLPMQNKTVDVRCGKVTQVRRKRLGIKMSSTQTKVITDTSQLSLFYD